MIANPFKNLKRVETKRLILRRVHMDDAPVILAYASDPRVQRYTFYTEATDLGVIRRYLSKVIDAYWQGDPAQWAVTLKGHDKAIGLVGFGDGNRRNRMAELGYELAPAYWGQGYATEAAQAALRYGFERNLYRIEARIFAGNAASVRLAKRIGMQYEGTHRAGAWAKGTPTDVLIYAILQPEFEARKA